MTRNTNTTTTRTATTLALLAATTAGVLTQQTEAGRERYRGRWTFTQNVSPRCNDFHINISVESPAFVVPAHNFVKDRFTDTGYTMDFGPSFRADWESPTSDILNGQTIDIGFDFETDKPFTVTSAYWTWNGQTYDGWQVPLGDVNFKKVGKTEHFDDYWPGPLEQDGWEAWDHDPVAGEFFVTDGAPCMSLPHALEIDGFDDAVLRFDDIDFDGGTWAMSAWQYIPSEFESGGSEQMSGSYFNLLNTYEPGGPYHWSAQLQFDSNDGMLKVYYGNGMNTVDVPYETDRWVKIQTIVDLDNDWTQVYYDDHLVTEYSWTGGVIGDGGGALDIAVVDLFAQGSSRIFYDDLVIEKLPEPEPECPADLDGDGMVSFGDLLMALSAWGECGGCPTDLDGDGMVSFGDLLAILSAWGPCPE